MENIKKLLSKNETKILNGCVENLNTTVFGCGYGEKSLLTSCLNKQVLYVANDVISASKLYEQFSYLGFPVNIITNRITNLGFSNYSLNTLVSDICNFLFKLQTYKINIVTPDFLTQKLPSFANFTKNILKISVNTTLERKELTSKLALMGYKKAEVCSHNGQFCVRGDVCDVFVVGKDNPVRISFFDDEIESLHFFETESFSKIENINEIEIIPNTLMLGNTDSISNKLIKDKDETLSYEAKQKQSEIFEQLSVAMAGGNFDYVYLLSYLEDFNSSVFDYLSENHCVVYDEPKKIKDTISNLTKEGLASFKLLKSAGELNNAHKDFYLTENEIFNCKKTQISFQNINSNNQLFTSDQVVNVNTMPIVNYNYNYNQLLKDLTWFKEDNFTVVLFALDEEYKSRLKTNLARNGISVVECERLEEITFNAINIVPQPLTYSVALLDSNLILISSTDLTNRRKKGVLVSKNKSKTFKMPQVGDYVVHDVHGIGLCDGIKTLTLNGYSKDYLVIKFRGSDVLYLPTENIESISLYLGNEKEPKLNKMGGQEFEKAKARVKENVSKIAIELVKLYNERKSLKGYVYPEDNVEMQEFEQSFIYSETQDQLKAVADIKQDMESGKVMDRLVCGDVGYGKTEVALRGAYKTILAGKQVAMLVPTTILCEQHFNTMKERFSPFAINIAKLNRFQTKAQQEKIINDLMLGKIDMICGTHRMLSQDVNFKDLGLLILDEEQRFGVKDKEKIKQLKNNVNVLTLSATPIPRTLHMSMVGIRDISVIETPPNDRLPVQTFVTEFSDALINDAVAKELNRNGQVLIIYNRVESILEFANRIKEMFPDVQVGVAHGQMPEKTLELEILKVYNGETRILIATTLIENGVDLPNANTLIVCNADTLGLSQLYQLRGRVGRSTRLGYAYFTYKPDKNITETAYKRLQALQEFVALGSGFKIAMRDLEIRGAGNVLGGEQHGHMEKVGYDMYCKLLNMAIKEINGQKVKQFKDVKLDISLDATVPNSYCDNNNDRIKIYSLLSEVSSMQELTEAINQIDNAYGQSPKQVRNLGLIALIKNLSQKLSVSRVRLKPDESYVMFYESEDLTLKVENAFKTLGEKCVINFTKMPIINLNLRGVNTLKQVETLINILLMATEK